eukprot:s105_g13.t1
MYNSDTFEVMAFELTYRLTFIDTVEAPPIGALPRSRSLPVLGSIPTADEEVHYQAYVSQLSQQMAERDLTLVAEQPEVAEAENEATGHQWGLCRRPCIYHLACGTCTKGADCGFCHMSHGERVPKLDKQQRTVLQELGAGELLALVLEPLSSLSCWRWSVLGKPPCSRTTRSIQSCIASERSWAA